ncbi:hypothetical protein QBC33DRAFT_100824 [Phialemonium atrogriseum]|uniref:Uncharacterized protein n=1 Tax=Phialemonium atrogriseum TaxID=1093897 RepID=A0AAJ0C0G0_9PEZI|nr:uncharacterized protein QBC33DRAFT_100824 [Phialemonium atrogriseum]KAK1766459.1 hypothetical protein QBC33DRAFT_100824 [Phialemonium atrogriseum]
MRPTTPDLKIYQSVDPTSPPQTPITASPVSNRKNTPKVRGLAPQPQPNSHFMSQRSNIRPLGNGPHFSFTRPTHPDELSPLSSSSSSAPSDSSSSESGSVSSEQPEPPPPPPPPPRVAPSRTVTQATFTVEELSDFDDSDDDRLGVVRPHTIEDADSERSRSRSRNPPEIDRTVMYKFQNLGCDDSDSDETDIDEDEYQEFLFKRRAERRQKRMSSGSIGKRTIAESIGSDTDREDLRVFVMADQVGSSARRLRRKVGDRRSLQFTDPPLPRIDQMDEPPTSDDDFLDDDALKELPYYTLDYITMEIDSP